MRRSLYAFLFAFILILALAPAALACYECESGYSCQCHITPSGYAGYEQCGCECDVPMIDHICYGSQTCVVDRNCLWYGAVNSINGLGAHATQQQYAAVSERFLSPEARADVEAKIAEASQGLPQVQADMTAVALYRQAFRDELLNLRPRKHRPRNSLGQSAVFRPIRFHPIQG